MNAVKFILIPYFYCSKLQNVRGYTIHSPALNVQNQHHTLFPTLLHHGMIIAGLPYTFQGQMRLDEITGCSPYGASTIAGGTGERWPSNNELEGARFQGNFVAEIAARLFRT